MHDPDSYSLYCAMLLQEYQQHGIALNRIDPSIIEACQSYLNYPEVAGQRNGETDKTKYITGANE